VHLNEDDDEGDGTDNEAEAELVESIRCLICNTRAMKASSTEAVSAGEDSTKHIP